MKSSRLKYPQAFLALTMIAVVLIASAPGYAYTDLNPSQLLNETVVIAPGNPIQIAIAYTTFFPDGADIPIAVQMAMADYGDIKGFSLQANEYDTGCDGSIAEVQAANIVANSQHVGVIGPVCSSSTWAALPTFESAGLVMISPSSTGAGLYSQGPNVFNRVVLADPENDPWDARVSALASVHAWETDFVVAHHHSPWIFAKYAYDATMLLLARIEQVSSLDGGGNLVIDRQALAQAVRLTSGYSGVTGSITLDAFGTRLDQYQNAVWSDDFADENLSESWTWVDENPSHWSLTENPGYLRIIAQSPAQNRLTLPVPEGDFEMRTRVLFEPSEHLQYAKLHVEGDKGALMLGRAFCGEAPPLCLGNAIYFDLFENGSFIGSNYAMTTTVQNEAYLLLKREGSQYTGFVSTNGTEWQELGSHTPSFTPQYIALNAGMAGTTTEIPADFDFFELETSAEKLYLPMIAR